MTTEQRERAWLELELAGWEVNFGVSSWCLWIPGHGHNYGHFTRDEAIDYAIKLTKEDE